jgi:hypothetical protein
MMTKETYNKLQMLCTVLINIYSELRSVTQGMYKVYDASYTFFTPQILEVLSEFENIGLRDLYKDEILNELPNQSEWFTNPLFKKEDDELFVSHDLELVLYYFLINVFQESITEFVNFLESEQNNYNHFMRWNESKEKLTIRRGIEKTLFDKLNDLENCSFVWHLFNQVSYGIIYATNEYDFVIELEKIKKLLTTAQEFNFDLLIRKFDTEN